MRFSAFATAIAILLTLSGSPASANPHPGHHLSERDTTEATKRGYIERYKNGAAVTFHYKTTIPGEKNWIGIYPKSGGGPVDQKKVSDSLAWAYAVRDEGYVQVDDEKLDAGDFQAYFLENDGYKWLASPIDITLHGSELYFPLDEATFQNARQNEAYKASVSGILLGRNESPVTFKKEDGDKWIEVSLSGDISGKPDDFVSGTSHVTISATAHNGGSATIKISITVKKATENLVDEFRVLSMNIWQGGNELNNPLEKQLRVILEENADIVGLQEADTSEKDDSGKITRSSAQSLAEALGWAPNFWQSDFSAGTISRYPMPKFYGEHARSGGNRVNLNGKKDDIHVNFWNAHLWYTPYGPYEFCYDHKSVSDVIKNETESGRTPQIQTTIDAMKGQIDNADDTPVILVGDFNAPSHLDYVVERKEDHCGQYNVPWPTSKIPTDAGLSDSYRDIHKYPQKEETTWSPIYPRHDGTTGPKEPQDRIDFIYHKGLVVKDSKLFDKGDTAPYQGDFANNIWPSDHRAVLTTFQFK